MTNPKPVHIPRGMALVPATDHKPLAQSDIGRVFVHGTSVRVVLLNHLGDEPFQVTIKCMEPTEDGKYIVTQVDSRNLVPTSQRIYPNAPDYVNGLPGFSGVVEPEDSTAEGKLAAIRGVLTDPESGWVSTQLAKIAEIVGVGDDPEDMPVTTDAEAHAYIDAVVMRQEGQR